MRKPNLIVILISIFCLSCAFRKKIDPKKKYSTDYGFTFKVPFEGPWYQGKADFYLFGKEPESDGSSTLAEVRHGYIYETDEYMKVTPLTLKKVFEPSLKASRPKDKIEFKKTEVFYRPYKKTACMFFKQNGIDKESKLVLNYNGMICLLPNDGNKYVWMAVSQRKPSADKFEDLTAQEKAFFESLTFEKIEEDQK